MTRLEEGQEERIKEAVRARMKEYSFRNDVAFRSEIAPYIEANEHVVNIGFSILCTKWEVGYPGGGFVQAIVSNNLMEAFGRADSINLNAIGFYVYLIYNQGYVS
ncbi:hypothetical protein UFOVP699_157 [uncultured Caudovirales phage]|uniref:Uncharacterized protein n=1 Tax=uncultured Caudovirales phage TaxID=2100421 RepID=A0A6J5NPY7_9CAUD|nr:hypothetical protein UFOVP699_157 [uncultured Caudovirales phage]